jgi:hypothetical protein
LPCDEAGQARKDSRGEEEKFKRRDVMFHMSLQRSGILVRSGHC